MTQTRFILYPAVAALVAGLFLFNYVMDHAPFVEDKVDSLSNLQEKQVDTFLQMNGLLAGLATLALGGVGAFIKERRKMNQGPSPQLVVAAAACALSLYFGYLSYRYVIWMLSNHFFNLDNSLIAGTNLMQFSMFFVSIVALVDFVFAC